MNKLNRIDQSLIEKYLLKQLSKEELDAFNQKLKTDTGFARAFKIEQDIHQCLFYMENQETKAYLEKLYQERKENGLPQSETDNSNSDQSNKVIPINTKSENSNKVNLFMRSAAAILILGGVFALYFFLGNTPSTSELFAANYTVPQWEETVRGNVNLKPLKEAYEKGDYNQVIQLAEAAVADISIQLYRGISYLQLNKTENAIKVFEQLKNNENYSDQATWYLALCYLKLGDKISSKIHLRMLVDGTIETSENTKSKAAEILKKL